MNKVLSNFDTNHLLFISQVPTWIFGLFLNWVFCLVTIDSQFYLYKIKTLGWKIAQIFFYSQSEVIFSIVIMV